jgi:hypothetical protein
MDSYPLHRRVPEWWVGIRRGRARRETFRTVVGPPQAAGLLSVQYLSNA